MSQPIKVAFASARAPLIPQFLEKFDTIEPETELWVLSEFPPSRGRWIPYRLDRTFSQNLERFREALKGRSIRYAALLLEPDTPYRELQLLALRIAPLRTLFYNHNLDHYMLRPRALPGIIRHALWRTKEYLQWQFRPGGDAYTWVWRLVHPSHLRRPWYAWRARRTGAVIQAIKRASRKVAVPNAKETLPDGLTVVIPSRDGLELLKRLLPVIAKELHGRASQVVVVDNGSSDGTSNFVRSLGMECVTSVEPMTFARAVNRGMAAARFSRVCLLNNDMLPHEHFFPPLLKAFAKVPELFCATAQIFFTGGRRREETGKAYIRIDEQHNFPIACQEPIPGEDLSYVLYGSGGCSVYDTAKLRALGGIGEVYEPAYVEDLDIGVRAWQCGWPTVFVAGAEVTHEHRATTSRYYSQEDLERVLEVNYLRFLARSVNSPDLFGRLWRNAVDRLDRRAALENHAGSMSALMESVRARDWVAQGPGGADDELIFGIGGGNVAVFPGKAQRGRTTVLIATCYIPFPLSHGGAVRMYNLMRRAAADYRQVLVTFVDELHSPPEELLDICAEVVQVRRVGSHIRLDRGRPDVVEDFDSPAFCAALRQTVRKWTPKLAQLEFTQMALYARDCRPAKTLLVEHDVTIDLYSQLLRLEDTWDLRDQLPRWEQFERTAWREVDCVVTMSDKDRKSIDGARRCVTLGNGVDLVRFQPADCEPDAARLLFIGSFAHLPNLLALDFFLSEVWPLIADMQPILHVIAGSRHEYHYNRQRDHLRFTLDHPDLRIEGFVPDVRPAYARAAVVIAPLLASAGTNIKILEAMAAGKAIVSTTGGINGLDELEAGEDLIVENDPAAISRAIRELISAPDSRRRLERQARATAERLYDWDIIAQQQALLYEELVKS